MKKLVILSLLAVLCFTGMSFETNDKSNTEINKEWINLSPVEYSYNSITKEYVRKVEFISVDYYYKQSQLSFDGCGVCAWQTCGDGIYRNQQFCFNEGLPGVFWCKPCGGGW